MERKGVILDRDGTLINHVHYLYRVDQVKLTNHIKDLLLEMINKGFLFFLQTNQSGVERGLYKKENVQNCNKKMIELIGVKNLFKEVCISYKIDPVTCPNRKPNANFGLNLIQKYQIEKKNLYFIGDDNVDMLTAKNIGCHAIHVNSGKTKKESINFKNVLFMDDVRSALSYLNNL